MCGFLLDETKLGTLDEWKVRDSKKVPPRQRSILYRKLKEFADDYAVIKLTAMDIDKMRTETNLNKIEISHMHRIIDTLKPDKVIIDAIEANTKKFREHIIGGLCERTREKIKNGEIELVCENFADANYPIVGAASIIAKVIRDAEICKLQEKFKEYGDFGSGYPSDPRTIRFLKDWLEKNKELPYIVRRSWITAKELSKAAKTKREQKGLQEFAKGE
jgi:ribonuclease HII